MPGLLERFFDRGSEIPRKPHHAEGRRASRKHPPEFKDILAAEVAELRRKDKPLHHLKTIKEAERSLLPTLEGRVDKTTLDAAGNPLAKKVLTGLYDFFGSPKSKEANLHVPRSKKGLPEYSPALLARLDYRGVGKHDTLRVHMGALMLEREKLRKKLLQLTQKTNRQLERAVNDEEKEAIQDRHRHARLDLIRQLREAQGLMLSKTKELDAFVVRREKQKKERPSILKDAFEHARNFLRGTSTRKTAKRKTTPEQERTLTALGGALQSTWSKLVGTQNAQPSREELYAIIENGLQGIASIEKRVAARVGKVQPKSESSTGGVSDETPPDTGLKKESAVPAADGETKAAVLTPIASRILPREQLKGMSPDGLRYYLANRLEQIVGTTAASAMEGGLMTKDEYEKTMTRILEDIHTTGLNIDTFSTFIHEEISELESKPGTTFKGSGGILGIFTRTVQMVASERQIRNVTDQISGDFLWHAGITEKKEKIERVQLRDLLKSYVSEPKRTDQEIAALLKKLKATEVLWASDAFGDIKDRLAPIARDAQDIINQELARRKEMPVARGALLFHLGFSAKEVQHIPQEQFDEAITLWLKEPNRPVSEFQHALEVVNQLAARKTDNQHIAELYTNVSQRITDRIDALTKPKDTGTHEKIIHAEFGKLLKDLGIQATETPASPEAAQLHVNQWLSGVPEWSDDALRTTFAAVNALIAREGMDELHTQKESAFLPFLREVSAYLKNVRAERRARAATPARSHSDQTDLTQRDTNGEQEITEADQTQKLLDLTAQPSVIRGAILQRFAIPGADVAVGEKYFENRIKEWFALPTTTTDEKDRFAAFCKEQLMQIETITISKKRQKREIFERAIQF
ncbi:hypothetical protein HY622_04290 [Candidatus Uhrbacteria bacterium]|nr:hypothetical protein [Candidatus Uhrbacteria bacterium]